MIYEQLSKECLNDSLLHSLISGWAKSRAGDGVNLVHGVGHTHCVFRGAIGGQSRDRESFYWQGAELTESAIKYHEGKHHYLSIFGNEDLPDSAISAAGYKLLFNELLMLRSDKHPPTKTKVPVKRVKDAKEAAWFNQQKGRIFILQDHLSDNGVYDFYTCNAGLLTSYARAIHQDNLFIVDDVQTHPDYRRKGLASAMLAEIAVAASHAGAHAQVLIASEGGIPLYLREQYEAVSPLRVFEYSVKAEG